jgi:hypothetical protein
MKTISLSRGMSALVDDEDYDALNAFKWFACPRHGLWYAVRNGKRVKTDGRIKRGKIWMHRVVTNAPEGSSGQMVDHKDGDGLNNQRENLRLGTSGQNQQNRHRLTTNTSGYRGVTWHRRLGKWQAQIKLDNKNMYLGVFEHAEDAARAYDKKAEEVFGEFAVPNLQKEMAA